jgi:hypothetical protein
VSAWRAEDSGPKLVAGSAGSPGRIAAKRSRMARRNRSKISASTKNRLEATQLWPMLLSRPFVAASAVRSSRSASSTMNGSLPPSSSTLLVTFAPASCATDPPARSLPGSDTPRTRGLSITCEMSCVSTHRFV